MSREEDRPSVTSKKTRLSVMKTEELINVEGSGDENVSVVCIPLNVCHQYSCALCIFILISPAISEFFYYRHQNARWGMTCKCCDSAVLSFMYS